MKNHDLTEYTARVDGGIRKMYGIGGKGTSFAIDKEGEIWCDIKGRSNIIAEAIICSEPLLNSDTATYVRLDFVAQDEDVTELKDNLKKLTKWKKTA